jgi:molecular chaperone GrpE (heat shock protein)
METWKKLAIRPTAEQLLSQFDNLHLLIEEKGKKISSLMVEDLTILQKKILTILQSPKFNFIDKLRKAGEFSEKIYCELIDVVMGQALKLLGLELI